MPLGMEVGLGPGNLMLDGDPASPQKGTQPQFLAHVYCGQTAGWIKMPLGMEVGLSLGDTVRWDLASLKKGGTTPNFRPMCIVVAKRLDASGYHLVQR